MPPLSIIARQVLEICLLRRGPQDLPYSQGLLVLTMTASAAVGYPAMSRFGLSDSPALDVALTLGFTLAYLHGVLTIKGLRGRFVQTASAVFGTDVVVTGLALPIMAMTTGPSDEAPVSGLLMLALVLWNLAILGHILRHALAVRLPVGVLWALAYVFGSTLFIRALGV